MGFHLQRLIFSVLCACAGMAATAARAQAPSGLPVADGPRYIVSYLEVMPTQTENALWLVRQFTDLVRSKQGNLRAEALQRIGYGHQFVLLQVWEEGAMERYFAAAETAEFRAKIAAIGNAPIDERVHFPLSVLPPAAPSTGPAIFVVTHVDVIPPQRQSGSDIIKELADGSRRDDGNLRFEAVTQVSRQNHFTIIEMWRDRAAAERHGMAAHTRAFREKLIPMAGALYDERFYKALN